MKMTVVFMGAESLSLESLSAVLKQGGHEVALAFDPSLFDDVNYFKIPVLHRILDDRNGLIRKIISQKPDIVGFSVFTDNFAWALSVARDVKKALAVPIVFGGVYATAAADYVLSRDCVDIVCLGEGEYPMLELLNSMQKCAVDYGIKNLWFKKKDTVIKNPIRPLCDLDALPMSDKSLFEDEVNIGRMYMTMTTRGCPFACSYCSHNFLSKFHGQRDLRRRSVDKVMRELLIMKKRYRYREVGFYDSIFTVNKQWTLDLMKRYKKEINVPFRAISHPLCIDQDIAVALKESGCHRVQFGVQTFNEKTKKEVLPELILLLNAKEYWIRMHAALALGKIKSKQSIEPLISALDDENFSVRWHAIGYGRVRSGGRQRQVLSAKPYRTSLSDRRRS